MIRINDYRFFYYKILYIDLICKTNFISFRETCKIILIKIIIFKIANVFEIINFLILINYIKIYNLDDIIK